MTADQGRRRHDLRRDPDGPPARTAVTFHTITDERFAPGTIALINSLRLTGHSDPVVVLDCGLRDDQRRVLGPFATLVPWDRRQATNPTLFKPFAALTRPSGVVAIVDSDVIVTGSLADLVRRAERGAICAFPDPESDRWFEEWASIFALQRPLRRQPYVNAGFLMLSVDRWPEFLPRWWSMCRTIWDAPTIYEPGHVPPTAQADQDALNALLMSEVGASALELIDPDLAPATGALSAGVQVVNEQTLECRFREKQVLLLHSAGRAKPWVSADWVFLRPTAYTRLLRRTLAGADLAMALPRGDIPLWLRRGRVGMAAMVGVTAVVGTAWRLGELPLLRRLARPVLRVLQRGSGRWRSAT